MWTANISRPGVDKKGNPTMDKVAVKMGGPYASVPLAFAAAQQRFNPQGCKVHSVAKTGPSRTDKAEKGEDQDSEG